MRTLAAGLALLSLLAHSPSPARAGDGTESSAASADDSAPMAETLTDLNQQAAEIDRVRGEIAGLTYDQARDRLRLLSVTYLENRRALERVIDAPFIDAAAYRAAVEPHLAKEQSLLILAPLLAERGASAREKLPVTRKVLLSTLGALSVGPYIYINSMYLNPFYGSLLSQGGWHAVAGVTLAATQGALWGIYLTKALGAKGSINLPRLALPGTREARWQRHCEELLRLFTDPVARSLEAELRKVPGVAEQSARSTQAALETQARETVRAASCRVFLDTDGQESIQPLRLFNNGG